MIDGDIREHGRSYTNALHRGRRIDGSPRPSPKINYTAVCRRTPFRARIDDCGGRWRIFCEPERRYEINGSRIIVKKKIAS